MTEHTDTDTTFEETDSRPAREQLWSPLFVLIVAMTLCCFLVGQGLNAGTSVYLSRAGESAALAGVLAAVFSIAAAITRLVCGPVVDSVGRMIVVASGIVLLLIGTAVPAFVNNAAVFTLCRIVQGVGFSAASTAAATAAADVLPLSRLGEGIGYYGLGQAISMSIGPALALFLVSTDPAENLYLGFAAIGAVGLALTAFCRYERNPAARLPKTAAYRVRWEKEHAAPEADAHADGHVGERADTAAEPKVSEVANTAKSERADTATEPKVSASDGASFTKGGWASLPRKLFDNIFEKRALPGTLPMIILTPAFGFGIFFVGLYGTQIGVGNPGLFYTISAISMILVRLKSGAFMDRVAPLTIFAAAIVCGLAGFGMLFAAGANDLVFYASGLLYGACLGVSVPLGQSVAVKNTPPERWGAANALYMLATDIGIGVGTAIWGFVNDLAGFQVTIVCVMVCLVCAFVLARFTYPKATL